MLDKSKGLKAREIYHIWTHANGHENLFRSDENYRYFMDIYSHHVSPLVNTLAYCLMPNHLHLMIKVRDQQTLKNFYIAKKTSKFSPGKRDGLALDSLDAGIMEQLVNQQFSNLLNAYTKAYNKRFNRKGSLFISNFGRKRVEDKKYAIALMTYIHLNPVKHGFTEDLNDWKFSSWQAYSNNSNNLVDTTTGVDWFGGEDNFCKAHEELQANQLMDRF
jgi:REP element-mobilizing transposase RayT